MRRAKGRLTEKSTDRHDLLQGCVVASINQLRKGADVSVFLANFHRRVKKINYYHKSKERV